MWKIVEHQQQGKCGYRIKTTLTISYEISSFIFIVCTTAFVQLLTRHSRLLWLEFVWAVISFYVYILWAFILSEVERWKIRHLMTSMIYMWKDLVESSRSCWNLSTFIIASMPIIGKDAGGWQKKGKKGKFSEKVFPSDFRIFSMAKVKRKFFTRKYCDEINLCNVRDSKNTEFHS